MPPVTSATLFLRGILYLLHVSEMMAGILNIKQYSLTDFTVIEIAWKMVGFQGTLISFDFYHAIYVAELINKLATQLDW